MSYTEQCQNGHPMAPGAAFCDVCGVPRPVSFQTAPVFCVNGHPMTPGAAHCGTCGGMPAQSFAAPGRPQQSGYYQPGPYQPGPYQPGPYQPGPYQANYGYPYAVVPGRPNNGMAIASLVLGIVWVYWIGSVLAVIFGFVALSQIKVRNEMGRGMAIAGIVLGFVGIAILIIALIAWGAASNNNNYYGGVIFSTLGRA